jgi:chemotaxis-related protein WspD
MANPPRSQPPRSEPGGSVINDCWNKIGVRGDASCPELAKYVHCRNCPVHAAAAVTLLNRDSPAGYIVDWTSHFAKTRKLEELDTHSAVIFRLGAEWFALPSLIFDEVAELRTIHSLPHRRSSVVLGLVNVRGELIICVSLGRMLGLEEAPSPQPGRNGVGDGRLAVIRHEGARMAFPVDEVQRTHRYHPRDLKPVPATLAKAASACTKGILSWQDRMVGCLDEQLIVHTLNRSVA